MQFKISVFCLIDIVVSLLQVNSYDRYKYDIDGSDESDNDLALILNGHNICVEGLKRLKNCRVV